MQKYEQTITQATANIVMLCLLGHKGCKQCLSIVRTSEALPGRLCDPRMPWVHYQRGMSNLYGCEDPIRRRRVGP